MQSYIISYSSNLSRYQMTFYHIFHQSNALPSLHETAPSVSAKTTLTTQILSNQSLFVSMRHHLHALLGKLSKPNSFQAFYTFKFGPMPPKQFSPIMLINYQIEQVWNFLKIKIIFVQTSILPSHCFCYVDCVLGSVSAINTEHCHENCNYHCDSGVLSFQFFQIYRDTVAL